MERRPGPKSEEFFMNPHFMRAVEAKEGVLFCLIVGEIQVP